MREGSALSACWRRCEQYAKERLDASGEGDATRIRHLDYFLALVEEMQRPAVGQEEAPRIDAIDIERENFRSAYAFCNRAEGDARVALRINLRCVSGSVAAFSSWEFR